MRTRAITRAAHDLEFLSRVNARYQGGATQAVIAEEERLRGGSGALIHKVRRLGFQFSRKGGLQLVDLIHERPFSEWVSSGDLRSATQEVAA